MPASGSTSGRYSTVERENYTNNANWMDQLSAVAVLGSGLTVTGAATISTTLGVTGLTTLTGGLAPTKGFPGTSHPTSSSLNANISSATVTGNDCAGQIVFASSASGVAQNQTLCVITFANASLYTNTPIICLTNLTSGAASTTLHAGTYGVVTASATAFSVVVLGAALTASGSFTCGYIVIGVG